MNDLILLTKKELRKEIWKADPRIRELLEGSENLAEARDKLFYYLNNLERNYFNVFAERKIKDIHIIEKNNAKVCIKVFKNIIRSENEKLTGFSALKILFDLSHDDEALKDVTKGFLCEFLFLIKGINANSGITEDQFILPSDSQKASAMRSEKLDEYSSIMNAYLKKFKSGIDDDMSSRQESMKKKILGYFNASEKDWEDYIWQLRNIINDHKTLAELVKIDTDELDGLAAAEKNGIPFQITPYYLSLFNEKGRTMDDRAIRAQVLPDKTYCEQVTNNRTHHTDMDFMGEKSTTPIEAITRRYPQIVILKPVDTCPQICVYCQRNWEIKPLKESKSTRRTIAKAIEWISSNENISEVLITGGDPFILADDYIDYLLGELSKIGHVERIRIGTRVLVTMPCRITDSLLEILEKYHVPAKLEICIVTHFEHPTEITPESVRAITKIRKSGMSIYNQQVFTYYNSLRFETCALRRKLKLAGIDPYYTFNTKGKEETAKFRIPIARIEQERKEEARFLPGIIRTDEPVFNVPKLGKSHLRARQDHELIMINAAGERIYRFYPWESKVTLVDDYIYTDVPICQYLERLKEDNENLEDYKSIWYYY